MSEEAEAGEASRDLQEILDLFASAGFDGARISSLSPEEKVAAGLAWCIHAAGGANEPPLRNQLQVWEAIEAGLESMVCPHPLQAHHLQGLDCRALHPVVQWAVDSVLATRPQITNEVSSVLSHIKEGKCNLQQLEIELSQTENSIQMMLSHLSKLDQKKVDLLSEIQQLHQQIDETSYSNTVQELVRMLETLKVLERQESDLWQKKADMPSEILKLEKEKSEVNGKKSSFIDLAYCLNDSSNKLSSAKRELAAKLREILSLKRQLDDVPAQTELIQYERRFSELYVQIQEKHLQTRKHYATYNALLEIKELMQKEISLLNSINSQFNDAITSTAGRSKLVDSMEVIVKGTQQKLEKVQLSFLMEQKHCDSLKEKYAAAIAEQRHFSSLLKAFQAPLCQRPASHILSESITSQEL